MTVPSSGYDYNPNHFHFVRHHTGEPPERSAPISCWGRDVRDIAAAAIATTLLILACGVL